MKRNMKSAAILVLTLAMITGCGKGAAVADESSIPDDTLSVSEETALLGNDDIGGDESMTESEMIATAGDTSNTAGNIEEELPDYLKGDASGSTDDANAPDASVSDDLGEGLNVEAGSQIVAAENAESCTLGETYTIHTHSGDIELTVNSVDVVKNTDPLSSAKKIARVNYSYSNVGCDSGMLISTIFFRMADSEGKALPTYLPDYTKEENAEPQVVEKGESCDAVIGFEIYEDFDEITLFFDDQTTGINETQELFWVIR